MNVKDDKEYAMLRQEILQYLEEYQSVRNMMYIVTTAILGLNSTTAFNTYIFLLPLIVIMPSYLIAHDYGQNVERAASYLQVFYEEVNYPYYYHWESRLSKLNKKCKSLTAYLQVHILPYIVCASLCIVLYFVSAFTKFNVECNSYIEKIVSISIGGIVALICFVVFFVFQKCRRANPDYMGIWKEIMAQENIGSSQD